MSEMPERENKVPFLLCLKDDESIGAAVARLDEVQRKNHRRHFRLAEHIGELRQAPVHFDYQGAGEDYDREMRQAPRHRRDETGD